MRQFLRTTMLTLVIAGVIVSKSKAQEKANAFDMGVGASGFLYQGDLSNNKLGSVQDMRYGMNVYGRYRINNILAIKGNFHRGRLKGDDMQFPVEWRQKRGYKFSSPLTEVSVVLEASLVGDNKYQSYRQFGARYARWQSSIFAGAGLAVTNASRDWSKLDRDYFGKDATERIPMDSASTPDRMVFIIPIGINLRYAINDNVGVYAEAGYRFSFTDNMDGYKHAVYSHKTDGYTVYTIGVSYRFTTLRKHFIQDAFREKWNNKNKWYK